MMYSTYNSHLNAIFWEDCSKNSDSKYLRGSLPRDPQLPERRREYLLLERLWGYQRQVLIQGPRYLAPQTYGT